MASWLQTPPGQSSVRGGQTDGSPPLTASWLQRKPPTVHVSGRIRTLQGWFQEVTYPPLVAYWSCVEYNYFDIFPFYNRNVFVHSSASQTSQDWQKGKWLKEEISKRQVHTCCRPNVRPSFSFHNNKNLFLLCLKIFSEYFCNPIILHHFSESVTAADFFLSTVWL